MIPIHLNYNFIETVFFDFDGVLVDSVPIKTKAYQEIFKPFGNDAVKLITEYHIANGGIDRYKKIEYVLNKLGKDIKFVNRLANEFATLVKDLVIQSESIPGMIELAVSLKRNGIPAYIVSGTPEIELTSIVESRNWQHHFKGVYGSPRTKVQIVDSIFEEHKYNRKKSIFIGDATTDYNTALQCGVWYIGVPELENRE